MPDVKFQFLNEAEIKRKILAFPDKLQRQVLRSGISAACRDLRKLLRENTPVHTGNLRDHWKISVRVRRKTYIVGRVSNRARHAWLVEFGSGPRYQKARKGRYLYSQGKYTGQMPANPFGRTVFEENAQRFIDKVSSAVKTYMQKRQLL